MTVNLHDPMESVVFASLEGAGERVVSDVRKTKGLDFHLPEWDVYVEVCQFHTPRKIEQLSRVQDCVLIQGRRAAEWFAAITRADRPAPPAVPEGFVLVPREMTEKQYDAVYKVLEDAGYRIGEWANPKDVYRAMLAAAEGEKVKWNITLREPFISAETCRKAVVKVVWEK